MVPPRAAAGAPATTFAPWAALSERLRRTGAAEGARLMDTLDPTQLGCSPHALLHFLLEEPLSAVAAGETRFEGLPRPLRAELLLLLARLGPRLPSAPLVRLLAHFLEGPSGAAAAEGWDVRIGRGMLRELRPGHA
eukprot:COSAG04_NODE_269_length_18509_cov_13.576480_14_plen_135_part_01